MNLLFALKTRELFFTELFGVLIAKTRKSFLVIRQGCFPMLNAQRQTAEEHLTFANKRMLKVILLGNSPTEAGKLEKCLCRDWRKRRVVS